MGSLCRVTVFSEHLAFLIHALRKHYFHCSGEDRRLAECVSGASILCCARTSWKLYCSVLLVPRSHFALCAFFATEVLTVTVARSLCYQLPADQALPSPVIPRGHQASLNVGGS